MPRKLPASRVSGTFHDLGPQEIPGLTGPRRVQLFLPPGAGRRPLPVLYLFDGQNLFGDEGSFAGAWRVHEAMERRALRGRRTAIVVALDHGNEHRIGDYAPFSSRRIGEGRAPLLLRWLEQELVPRIDREFPTLGTAASRVIGGSSMGGLISLFAVLTHPGTFGRGLVMSPSLFLGAGRLLRLARARPRGGLRLYLDGGANEMGGALTRELSRLGPALREAGVEARDLCVRIDPRGDHSELAWRRRLPRALEFLLRRD